VLQALSGSLWGAFGGALIRPVTTRMERETATTLDLMVNEAAAGLLGDIQTPGGQPLITKESSRNSDRY